MTLNHLNLTVISPEDTSAFLANYFGLRAGGGNAGMQLLHDDRGMVLTLTKARAEDRAESLNGLAAVAPQSGQGAVRYPSSFHIGFIQPNRERVDEINARLKADGYQVQPPSIQHGTWTFYFTAPGGFTIEVMA